MAPDTGIAFEVTESEGVVAGPDWGARPLRRILRRYLREPLADALLRQPPAPGTTAVVDVGAERLTFHLNTG